MIQWDLFSGQFTTNAITQKNSKMKSRKILMLAICVFATNLMAQTAAQYVAQGRAATGGA